MHRTTTRFWSCFDALPQSVQQLARKNFELLKNNPRHPSLHFKKVGKLSAARVGRNHRALAIEDDDGYIWLWIGTREDYDRLLSRQMA